MSVIIVGVVASSQLVGAIQVQQFGEISSVTPVSGWGCVRRNGSYTGPALQVRHKTDGTFEDIPFDEHGQITDVGTFPATERVVHKLYDQWGSEHLTLATPADTTWSLQRRFGEPGYHIRGTGGSAFISPSTVLDAPPWALGTPLWLATFERGVPTGLRTLFKIDGGGYMEIGLWVEARDLHWRINGSGPDDWPDTDWYDNAETVQGSWERVIADMTGGSPAQAYRNGVSNHTKNYTSPITYNYDTAHFSLGAAYQGLGSPFIGRFVELHVFNKAGATPVSQEDIGYISTAMLDGYSPLPGQQRVDLPWMLHAKNQPSGVLIIDVNVASNPTAADDNKDFVFLRGDLGRKPKMYWEVEITQNTGNVTGYVGVVSSDWAQANFDNNINPIASGIGIKGNGDVWRNDYNILNSGGSFTQGDIVQIEYDHITKTISFGINGVWVAEDVDASPVTYPIKPFIQVRNANAQQKLIAKSDDWNYAPRTPGAVPLQDAFPGDGSGAAGNQFTVFAVVKE